MKVLPHWFHHIFSHRYSTAGQRCGHNFEEGFGAPSDQGQLYVFFSAVPPSLWQYHGLSGIAKLGT